MFYNHLSLFLHSKKQTANIHFLFHICKWKMIVN